MKKVIIIRYGELYLKGDNRRYFENILIKNINFALKGQKYNLLSTRGRYVIEDFEDEEFILKQLSYVFGIHSYSIGYSIKSDFNLIKTTALAMNFGKSFKISCNRADKKFPLNSQQINAEIGAYILDMRTDLKVDIHNPETTIYVDIREDGNTFVYSQIYSGVGGMPVGCEGRGLLMLSGGIDSPVAGYMIAKRGMKLSGIHFYSFPYTSELAKDKVVQLSEIISKYNNGFDLYIVPFTKIQEKINTMNTSYTVILMRRYMMRIADAIATKNNCGAIITGESLGQVASQTLESITATNLIPKYPVFRPLIGMDKEEIITVSKKISTYDISILPYDDCCTIFVPKHPVTKPNLEFLEKLELKLNMSQLITDAINETELIKIN